MTILQAIISGIVEGITEFLPVSSTGHLILTETMLRVTQTDFVKSFEIIIQLGAIAAVVIVYWRRLLSSPDVWRRVAVAFLPAAIIGFILYKFIKQYLIGNLYVVIAALFIGGIVLIVFEQLHKQTAPSLTNIENLTYTQAGLIGLGQALAIIPGVSRSGATIVGSLLAGTSRTSAVEFSFLLAIPTMIAATGLDLVKSNWHFTPSEYGLLAVGLLFSFITALVAIKFFLSFIQKHTFTIFGVYRILVAILFWSLIHR